MNTQFQFVLWTGETFDIANPDPDLINAQLLAGALSRICRFGGHVPSFYSVAQHSVHVSQIVPEHLALPALLHDAHEGLGTGDLISPFKRMLFGVKDIERKLDAAIAEAFGFDVELLYHPDIKAADQVMLRTEFRDLRDLGPHLDILEDVEPLEWIIEPWSPRVAEARFFRRYGELMAAEQAAAG